MIRIIVFAVFFLPLIFTACKETTPATLTERLVSGEFDAYEQLPLINCDSLQLDSLDLYYKDDSLFTGVCFTLYPNLDVQLERRQIFRGKLHGNRIMLSPKGDTLSLNLYNHGRLMRQMVGKREITLCDSLTIAKDNQGIERKYHFGEPFTGRCEKFYPGLDSNKIYIREDYYDGLRDGEMIIFDKEGNQIIKERYQAGEKVD